MMLIFDSQGNHFEFELTSTFTQICGESASGKTYILERLKNIVEYCSITQDYESLRRLNNGKVLVLSSEDSWEAIESAVTQQGYVICLDTANYLLSAYPALKELLLANVKNYYILAGRGDLGLPITTSGYKVVSFNKGARTFTLVREGI